MADAHTEVMRLKPMPWEAWMREAACKGLPPEMFFPNGIEDQAEPIEICNGCPVREDCLSYAHRHTINHGVWGGMSERARRRDRAQTKMAS